MAWNVVIAGGGFGGFYTARTLERVLPAQSARVTLVSEDNFMLYTPLLPGAAAGTLEPRHVVVPLREELRRTDLQLGRVVGADPAAAVLRIRRSDGAAEDLRYDQLVVALGSVSCLLPIPGLAEHGIGFRTLSEAIALRNGVLRTLEIAETLDDPAERRSWLTYVFVGAGYAGLEGLAELQDFAADVIELYPRCRTEGMRWILVEARDRVMPEISPSLAGFATGELRRRGIEIRTGTTLEAVSETTARLSDGETVPTRTVVWTAGVRPTPVIAELGLQLGEGGRLAVDQTLRCSGHENVWAIGDAAAVDDPARPGNVCPPTAQHATFSASLTGRQRPTWSITRAATSLRQRESAPTIAWKPGSASGAVITAYPPGGPAAATVTGGRPKAAPTASRSASTVIRAEVTGGALRSCATPSANGACAITAAICASPEATVTTWPPLNDEPKSAMRFGSTHGTRVAARIAAR
mgnify:CR=1 FL=1